MWRGWGRKPQRKDTGKAQRPEQKAAFGERRVCHVMHRVVGVLRAWGREAPDGAEQAGGIIRVSATMITRLDFIMKAIKCHYRV